MTQISRQTVLWLDLVQQVALWQLSLPVTVINILLHLSGGCGADSQVRHQRNSGISRGEYCDHTSSSSHQCGLNGYVPTPDNDFENQYAQLLIGGKSVSEI